MGKIYRNLFAYIFCTNTFIGTAKWPKVVGLVSILRQKQKKSAIFTFWIVVTLTILTMPELTKEGKIDLIQAHLHIALRYQNGKNLIPKYSWSF